MENNTELPTGSAPIESAQSFASIVAESKAALEAETEAQVKRGRGRPPGAKNVKGREHEEQQENPQKIHDVPPQQGPPIDLQPLLKDVNSIPFSLAALKYRSPALEMTPAEAETPAYYLSRLLNFYLPDIERKDPKLYTLTAWILSLIVVGVKKAVMYLDSKKKAQVAPQSNNTEQAPPPAQPVAALSQELPEGESAAGLFRGRI